MPRKIPRELPSQEPVEEEISEEEMEDELTRRRQPAPRTTPRFQPRQPAPAQPVQPKSRYSGFQQQAAEVVIDTETQEVIATDMWTAFANIMERLERIETTQGSMLGE